MAKKPVKPSSASRAAALASVVKKKFGASSAMIVTDELKPMSQMTEYVSSGLDVLDHYVLGRGGWPEGRWSEVIGDEGCGKTSLGYAFLAATQRAGGTAVMIDLEYSFDEERAQVYGVDLDALVILQPDNGEQAFEQIELMLKAADGEAPLGIVFDSLASAVPRATQESDKVTDRVGALAGLLSPAMRKLNGLLGPARAHIMLINQIRVKMGVLFGNNTDSPGGKAPKFYCSVRLQFFGGKAIKNAKGEHIGKVVTILAIKNRMTPPFRKVRVRIDYAAGFNNAWSTLEHAKTMKVIDARDAKGKGVAGVGAYHAALAALGWQSHVPEPTDEIDEGEHDGDDSDDDEEEDD